MKERPILFSGPMVKALLSGAKTQTRRLVERGARQSWLTPAALNKVQRFAPSQDGWWTMAVGEPTRIVHCGHEMDGGHIGSVLCPYGVPGDRLWVRETWVVLDHDYRVYPKGWALEDAKGMIPAYRADHVDPRGDGPANPMDWRPSIHMPRWASRLTLEVTEVRVQRLQEISEDDARAEGVETNPYYRASAGMRVNFAVLWDAINGKRAPWATNPWVWAISFRRLP